MNDEITPTKTESEVIGTTKCEQDICKRQVYEDATVDVVVGKVTDTFADGTVNVEGVDSDSPEIEKWCINCGDDEFDIQKPAGERSIEESNKYLTPSNVASFLAGILTMLTFASFIVL